MPWYERDYNRPDFPGQGGSVSQMGCGLPKPTPVVMKLLIANVLIGLLTAITGGHAFYDMGAVLSIESGTSWEVWRLITYQFLHGTPGHLFFNMMGLYFFGPPLERTWGPRRFIIFYLGCGVVGALVYLPLASAAGYLIGASGAVLGLLAACALLFPSMIVILVLFPLPIRVLAMLLVGWYVLNLLWTGNLADACHLGGMVAALGYVRLGPWYNRFKGTQSWRKREKMLAEEQKDQKIVDKILEKIHQHGMESLTRRERAALKKATDRQRQREKRFGR